MKLPVAKRRHSSDIIYLGRINNTIEWWGPIREWNHGKNGGASIRRHRGNYIFLWSDRLNDFKHRRKRTKRIH